MKISKKKLGVWMDHTTAHIIEIKNNVNHIKYNRIPLLTRRKTKLWQG